MDRIKSAFERAMERADKLAPPTEQERLEWKWAPEGRKLAAAFLAGKADPVAVVAKAEGAGRPYLLKGLVEVLVENLRLPKGEQALKGNEKVLEVLTRLKRGPMKEIAERVRYVYTQYLQYFPKQQEEAYAHLKEELQAQLEQAVRQKAGAQGPISVGNVEARPEFQGEWLRVQAQLEEPYENYLREFRQQIRNLP